MFGHLNIIPSLISEECTIPYAWQNKMFSITSTLNGNSSASVNKSISFGVSTAIWEEPDSFSSWRCHYVDNSSIVLKRYDICMRGSRGGRESRSIHFFKIHIVKLPKIRLVHPPTPDELKYSSDPYQRLHI